MPLTHEQRVANGKKAAETRARNKRARGISNGMLADTYATPSKRRKKALSRHSFGPVPSYSAKAEQRYNPKAPKLRKPLTKTQVKRATNDQLRAEMDYWGRIPGSQIRTRAQDMAYSDAKEELRMRANPRLATVIHEISPRSKRERERRYNERHEAHRARRGVKKQRGAR